MILLLSVFSISIPITLFAYEPVKLPGFISVNAGMFNSNRSIYEKIQSNNPYLMMGVRAGFGLNNSIYLLTDFLHTGAKLSRNTEYKQSFLNVGIYKMNKITNRYSISLSGGIIYFRNSYKSGIRFSSVPFELTADGFMGMFYGTGIDRRLSDGRYSAYLEFIYQSSIKIISGFLGPVEGYMIITGVKYHFKIKRYVSKRRRPKR